MGRIWLFSTKLTPDDVGTGSSFGMTVSCHGDLIVGGAEYSDSDTGSAYVFQTANNGVDWSQVTKLLANDGESGDRYGGSVSINGDLIVIGSKRYDLSNTITNTGTVFVYRTQDNGVTWSNYTQLLANDSIINDQLSYTGGPCIAIRDNMIAVCTPFTDDGGNSTGSVYVFKDIMTSYAINLTTNDGARDYEWEISETTPSHGKFYLENDIQTELQLPTVSLSTSTIYYVPEINNDGDFTLGYKSKDVNGDYTDNTATITITLE